MKRLYAFIAAGLFAAAPFTVMADDWTYDFDDFSTLYGDHYAQSSFDMTINGMQWHCHGVSYSKSEDYDWFNGKQSMELYGESKKDRKKGPEISVFQSLTPRDIGTVKFTVHEYYLHPASAGYQVSWIVEWSADGSSWSKVGDSFQAGSDPEAIERVVNQKNAYVRIVRADYTTFDYKSVTSNGKITNFDDLTITDYKGGPAAPTLSASKNEVDFGTLAMGRSKTDTVTVKFSGQDASLRPTYKLEGADTASFSYSLNQTAEGVDSIFVTTTVRHNGTAAANITATYGDLTAGIGLNVVGLKPRPNILFSGGEGTEESPYLISSKEDLQELSSLVNDSTRTFADNYFQMTNNIDLNTVANFMPIGNQLKGQGSDKMRYFSGNFDGAGYTISNLKEYYDNGLSIALFGVISGATIKNLTLASSSVTGATAVGGLVGLSTGNSTIDNCNVASDVTVKGTNFVAGVCAAAMLSGKLTISRTTNAATVTGNYAAGILSENDQEGTTIERCGNEGSINVSEYDGGGILALSKFASTNIANCYNTGNVVFSGTQQFGGGILGDVNYYISDSSTRVTIENCYNAAALAASYNIAPIVPANAVVPDMEAGSGYDSKRITVTNCYYASDLCSGAESVVGVNALASSSMKDASFTALLNQGQPVQYWVFTEGANQGYPVPTGSYPTTGIGKVNANANTAVQFNNNQLNVTDNYDSCRVYDMNGQRVDSSNMKPGVYMVRIVSKNSVRTVKLIKR